MLGYVQDLVSYAKRAVQALERIAEAQEQVVRIAVENATLNERLRAMVAGEPSEARKPHRALGVVVDHSSKIDRSEPDAG